MGPLHDLCRDFLLGVRFWTRLPVPVLPSEVEPYGTPDFSRIAIVLPVVGAAIGVVGAVALIASRAVGVPSGVAAGIAIASIAVLSGALHEDGLADTADGFGGGVTAAEKLEIMKDSRLGSFGGTALVLAIGLRWAALAAIDSGAGSAAAAAGLVAGASTSRVAALLPLLLLAPARASGAGRAASHPSRGCFTSALVLAAVLSALAIGPMFGVAAWFAAIFMALSGALGVTVIARHQIGGQTGDVAGASQQISEIAFFLALSCWIDI